MKRHVIILTFTIILCTISIIYNLSKFKSTSATTKEITEAINYRYTIKDYKGRVAVFKYGKEIPLEIYEIYTDTLPSTDSMKIREGIHISDETELQKAIEDYTG